MKTGIVIGRFQVPYLHAGHLELIATAIRESEDVLILLGTQNHIDERNPFSFMVRKRMIMKIFPQVKCMILMDDPSDEAWSSSVDAIANHECNWKCVLYHSRNSFKDHYSGKLPLREVEPIPGLSGTKIREEYGKWTG